MKVKIFKVISQSIVILAVGIAIGFYAHYLKTDSKRNNGFDDV